MQINVDVCKLDPYQAGGSNGAASPEVCDRSVQKGPKGPPAVKGGGDGSVVTDMKQ